MCSWAAQHPTTSHNISYMQDKCHEAINNAWNNEFCQISWEKVAAHFESLQMRLYQCIVHSELFSDASILFAPTTFQVTPTLTSHTMLLHRWRNDASQVSFLELSSGERLCPSQGLWHSCCCNGDTRLSLTAPPDKGNILIWWSVTHSSICVKDLAENLLSWILLHLTTHWSFHGVLGGATSWRHHWWHAWWHHSRIEAKKNILKKSRRDISLKDACKM